MSNLWALLLIYSVLLLTTTMHTAEAAQTISLARNSKAQYLIAIPNNASPAELNAANELKHYLDEITGANFVLIKERINIKDAACIYVGSTERLKKTFPHSELSSLGADGIFIKTSSAGDIFIFGEGSRGTLYAAYTFLEEYGNVRWYTPDVEKVPSNKNLNIKTPNRVYTPPMDYRDSFFMMFNNFGGAESGNNVERIKYCVRLKNNSFFNGIPEEWGGQSVCLPGAWPVFSQLIPTGKYFEERPEWFSEIDGKRTPAQLCLSNEEMRKEMAHNLLTMIKATSNVNMVTITQNDSGKDDYCHCADCKAADEKEGAPSGLLLQCVNSVAEQVEKEYPDLYVNTLAYAYNFEAPRVTKPRHNVSIQICCPRDVHRFDARENKDFYEGLKTWSGMTSRMLAWTYLIDYGDILNPIPNTFNIGANIRLLTKYKVKGIFAQGNSYAPIGDFPELKGWLIAKLLWDPYLNDKALIKEFMNVYYGSSGKPLIQYLELMDSEYSKLPPEAQAKAFTHNVYASPPSLTPWVPLDAMNRATELFEEAEKLAKSDKDQLKRVRNAKFSLEFQWILGWEDYKAEATKEDKKFLGPENRLDAFNNFIKSCQERGVWRLCEGNGSLSVLYPAIFNR